MKPLRSVLYCCLHSAAAWGERNMNSCKNISLLDGYIIYHNIRPFTDCMYVLVKGSIISYALSSFQSLSTEKIVHSTFIQSHCSKMFSCPFFVSMLQCSIYILYAVWVCIVNAGSRKGFANCNDLRSTCMTFGLQLINNRGFL